MFKKTLSMLLVIAMLMGMTLHVFATEADPVADINVTLRVIGSSLPDGKPSISRYAADYKGAQYQNWLKTTAFTASSGTALNVFLDAALAEAGLTCTMSTTTTKVSVTAPEAFGGHELAYNSSAYGSSAKWAVTVFDSEGNVRKESNSSFNFAIADGDQIVLRWAWNFSYEKSGKAWEGNTWTVADLSPAETVSIRNTEALIDAIGRVTPDSVAAIQAARAAYNALAADVKTYVTNYETLTAAETTYQAILDGAATRVPLPAPVISEGAAGLYTYAPNVAIEGVDAEKYTMVYRTSMDGENWGAWQPAVEKLLPMKTYYIQGMALTNDWTMYGDSAVSNVIRITTAGEDIKVVTEVTDKDTLLAALQAVQADGKLYIIDFKADIVIDDITQEFFRHDLPASSDLLLTSSNGSTYYFNEPGQYSFIGVSNGTTVTVRDLHIATIAGSSSLTPANEQQKVFAFIEDGGTVNFENLTAYTTSAGPLVGYNSYSNGVWKGTVNIYSGVMNATLDSSILNLAAGSEVNLIPTGDIMMEGKLGKVTSVNILDLFGVQVRTAVETEDYNVFTQIDTSTMTTVMHYSSGLRLNVTEGNTVPPVAQGDIVILPADDPNAAGADVTYVILDNDIAFTYKDRANAIYQIKFNKWGTAVSDHFYTRGDDSTPDDNTDDNGALNHTRTYTGLTQDTEYSFTIRFSSMDSSFTDVETTVVLRTTYTPVALDVPTLSDECEKTDNSITVTAPAASTQDATAVVLYRIRKAGTENWSAWQESLIFANLEGYTDYDIQAMYDAQHYLWLDSAESNTITIKTKAPALEAPVLTADGTVVEFDTITVSVPAGSAQDADAVIWFRIGTLKDTVDLLQMRSVTEDQIAWSEWQQSNVFTGLEADTTYYVQSYFVTEKDEWQNSQFSQIIEVKTAANESAPHFKVHSAAGKAGSEVNVVISINNNPGIITAYLNISYDETKLQLVGYQDAKLLPDGSFSSLDANPFKAQWDGALLPGNLTADGDILVLTFKILDGCQVDDVTDITVTYNANEVYDFNMNNVKFAVINGSVTVTSHTWGEATYTWSNDYTSCTASHSCTCCDVPVTETETVDATINTIAPTETEKGSTTYTASFTKAGFTEQTYVKVLPATGTLVEIETAEGCVGGTVEVAVSFQKNPGVVGAELKGTYNTGILEFASAENGSIMGNMMTNIGNGSIYLSWSDAETEGVFEDGVIVTLTFKIKDTASVGDVADIEITSFRAHDTDLNDVGFNTVNGSVTVADHGWSDWEYTWSDDYSTCTATRTMSCGCGETETQTVKTTIADKDCTSITFLAHFTIEGAEDQTETVTISDHDYVVSGNADGSEITYTCPECGDSYTDTVETGVAMFKISETKGTVGDTVEVTVSIANNPGLIMAQFTVDYDASILKLVGVKDAGMFDSFSVDGNVVTLGSLNETGDTTTDGTVVTLVFEIITYVNETTEIGISYANGAICNYNGESAIFAIDNGAVEVYSYLLGDVNCDGVVDIKDVTVLRRYLAGTVAEENVDLLAADCNCDSVVDIKDVTILRRYLAGTAELG